MAHDIDDNITNSCINFCISEYVRLSEHQRILRDKWFEGLSFEELSAKYHLSVNRIKKIVWGVGDAVLIKAQKMTKNKK